MKKLKKGRTLGRDSIQRKALFKSLANSLFLKKKIKTTLAKAKELRPFAEKLITKAKKNDFNTIRRISKLISKKAAKELFDNLSPFYKKRPGGYLRIIKLGQRESDAAKMAIIELVDYQKSKDKPQKKDSKKAKKEEEKKPKPKVKAKAESKPKKSKSIKKKDEKKSSKDKKDKAKKQVKSKSK
jgi:large subunit ribosomal protein L17